MKTRPFCWFALLGFMVGLAASAGAAPRVVAETPQPFPAAETFSADDPDNQLPKLTHKVDAVYPPELVAQGVRDRVFVAFVVDWKGQVQRARPAFGSHAACEAAAVAAVEQWTFAPGRHEGRPAKTQMMVEFRFEPDGPAPTP